MLNTGCSDVGYSDYSSFSRVYKRWTKDSPSEIRKLEQNSYEEAKNSMYFVAKISNWYIDNFCCGIRCCSAYRDGLIGFPV